MMQRDWQERVETDCACSTAENLHHARVRTKRRTIIITVLLCISLAAAVIAVFHRGDEPCYEGKRLSQWLEIYDKNSSGGAVEYTNAFEAVWTIGTNALPLYLKWIQYEESPWRKQVRRYLPRPMKRFVNDRAKENRQHYAHLGFYILRTNATAAIPELIVMMKDYQKSRTSAHAIHSLVSLGESTVPALESAMIDPNQDNRIMIFGDVGAMVYWNDTTNEYYLSLLQRLLTNDSIYVSLSAKWALEQSNPPVSTNTPPFQ